MAETETAVVDASRGWGLEAFALKHPFTFAGQEFRKFDVRVPTGADIEAYVKSPDRGLRVLVLKLVDADVKVLDAAHGSDYSRLMSMVGEYIAGVR